MNSAGADKQRRFGIAIAILLPTLVTWLYFILLEGHPLQKVAFAAKVVQFVFPLIWIMFVLKESIQASGIRGALSPDSSASVANTFSTKTSVGFGIGMGLAVSALMWLLYQMLPDDALTGLTTKAQAKIEELGFASPLLFIALGVFYALVHSFLEEYYFRWYVFGQLRRVTSFVPAMMISGLAFMAHHVIILVIYFGWTPFAAFLSLSIAVGGMIWAWQYEKSGSLIGPWISHMIVDAAIFYIGFDLMRNAGVL